MPISFCQKITIRNCKQRKAIQNFNFCTKKADHKILMKLTPSSRTSSFQANMDHWDPSSVSFTIWYKRALGVPGYLITEIEFQDS